MNDLFDDLKAIKSKLKKEEKLNSAKPQVAKLKEEIIAQKEAELKADFLEYMENCEVKKLNA